MATTNEDLQRQDDEYSAAFAEPEAQPVEVDEDAAFGLLPDAAEDGTSTPSEDSSASGVPAEAITVDESGEGAATDAGATAPAADSGKQHLTPDEQREKSWEGRLKAREEELRAREEALAAMEAELKKAKPEAAAEPDGDEAPAAERQEEAGEAQGLSDVVKQVEDGDMTAEQAVNQLTADFGPEFAKAVSALIKAAATDTASKVVDERVGPVSKSVEDLISGITDKSARDHFETIAEAHPDFAEIADGDELKQYLASLPEAEQAKANDVIANGSARKIVKLLDDVKAFAATQHEPEPEAAATPDPDTEAAMDAAEGVRSKGLHIPEKPGASSSYEDAWSEIPD